MSYNCTHPSAYGHGLYLYECPRDEVLWGKLNAVQLGCTLWVAVSFTMTRLNVGKVSVACSN